MRMKCQETLLRIGDSDATGKGQVSLRPLSLGWFSHQSPNRVRLRLTLPAEFRHVGGVGADLFRRLAARLAAGAFGFRFHGVG